MKIINIGWLYCENCDDDGMVVKTEKGCGLFLYQGDKFICPRCGGHGEIEIKFSTGKEIILYTTPENLALVLTGKSETPCDVRLRNIEIREIGEVKNEK
ncbi:hypothetical protein ACS34H_001285 [Escherichia coli]